MHAHVSLLGIALLPLLAGAIVLGCTPLWRRLFGAERATAMAGRFALGGVMLAVFLVGAAIYAMTVRPDLAPVQPVAWARVGFTTVLGLDLVIDGLALVIAGYAIATALAVQIAGLLEPRGGAGALGRSAVLLGATLLLGLAGTVWAAAIGWQVAMLMAGGTGPEGQVRRAARITDAGVWLAVLATAVGAGDLGLELVTRGALFGEGAALVTRGLGTIASIGLAVAVLGRALGFAAAVRGEGPASRAALHGLASTAGVLLMFKMHMVVALAPSVMAALAVAGGALAAGAGLLATRARDDAERLGRVTQALLGLMLVAVGMGAWVPACGLVVAHGLASAGLVLGGRVGRWVAGLSLGLAPIGAGLWIGEIGGAGFMYMSAWSPAINVALAVMCVVAAAGIGGAIGQVVRGASGQVAQDRSEETDEVAGAAGARAGLGLALGVLAAGTVAMDVPGATETLRIAVSPAFGASWLLQGALALGPRPPFSVELARSGAAVTLIAGWVGFFWLRGGAAWAVRWPGLDGARRRWLGLCRGLHGVIEGRVVGLMLRPGEVQAARAGGPPQAARALVGVLAGAAVLLGAVYCNPDVAQLGPSRTYPVDVGGLDPALLGTRRPGAAGEAE